MYVCWTIGGVAILIHVYMIEAEGWLVGWVALIVDFGKGKRGALLLGWIESTSFIIIREYWALQVEVARILRL